jgi:hypothetical protein
MQTRPFIAAVAAVSLIAWHGIGPCALAADLGLDFTSGGIERSAIANSNYGWSFSVTSPLIIDGLGLWDAASNGLVEPHEVGLWLTSTPIPEGVLLTSTTVSNTQSVPVASAYAGGRWLFSSVPALTLNPGTYTLGAVYRVGPTEQFDPFLSDVFTIVTAPGLKYGNPREIHDTPGLALPLNIGLNEHLGFFGPNLRVVVPEPAGLSAFAIGAAGVLLRRRVRCGGIG